MSDNKREVKAFVIKFGLALAMIGVFISMLLPDMEDLKRSFGQAMEREKNQIFLTSLVSNPVALYKFSEIDEKNGKMNKAIHDIEMAIGLLEMHGAHASVIERYQERLQQLRSRIKNDKGEQTR